MIDYEETMERVLKHKAEAEESGCEVWERTQYFTWRDITDLITLLQHYRAGLERMAAYKQTSPAMADIARKTLDGPE